MIPRKTLAATALAALLLSPGTGTAQMYGLSPEEMRSLQEFQRQWNSLDPEDRAGIEMPDADEIIRNMLDLRGKQCYSAQHRAMMPCEMVWNTPRSSGSRMPSFDNLMPRGSTEIPEPQLGVRSPAYRRLADQISDQFRYHKGSYEQARVFLMSFGFEPWLSDDIDMRLCDLPDAYPACDLYPEFFQCIFEHWCEAYWANEDEDIYLSIVVRAGTGTWRPHDPSIGHRNSKAFRQRSEWQDTIEQMAAEADERRRSEEGRQQGIENMRPFQ